MTPAQAVAIPRSNALLAGVKPREYARLSRLLRPVALRFGDILQEPEAVTHVYFPVDCLVSLFAPLAHEAGVEVGMIGSEGMVGVSVALGVHTSTVLALIQGSGTALRMDASAFEAELARNGALKAHVQRYAHVLMGQLGQTAACNAFHPIEARCARWLLMTRDRMQSNELELTHAFLARMRGVRRVGVTVAAGNLQRQGLITYSRGRIEILDGKRLAKSACECYATLEQLYGTSRRA
jgi:CRP-like cAMP-binding protein